MSGQMTLSAPRCNRCLLIGPCARGVLCCPCSCTVTPDTLPVSLLPRVFGFCTGITDIDSTFRPDLTESIPNLTWYSTRSFINQFHPLFSLIIHLISSAAIQKRLDIA